MDEFDVLDGSQKLPKKLFLQASAGTGKTFSIVHMVVRLILEEKLNPREIVVVTFTRKAACQLKFRIRRELRSLFEALLSKNLDSTYPYITGKFLEEPDNLLIELGRALEDVESMQISTVHSFASGLWSQLQLQNRQEEREFGLILQELQEQIWLLIGETIWSYHEEKLIEDLLRIRYKNEVYKMSAEIASLIAKDKPLLTPKYQDFTLLEANIQTLLKEWDLSKIEVLREKVRDFYGLTTRNGLIKPEVEESLRKFSDLLNDGEPLTESHLQTLAKISSIFSRKKLKKKAEIIPFQDLLDKLEDLRLEQWVGGYALLTDCIKLFRSKMEPWLNSREDKAIADYTLKQVSKALQEFPKQAASLTNELKALIVDEFQDTDPWQWEIFKSLVSLCKKTPYFMVVGDPKQAIYAFRQADIYTYMRAKKWFGSACTKSLKTNWRSSASLVRVLNRLFAHRAFSACMMLARTNEYIEIEELSSQEEKSDEIPLELWTFSPEKKKYDWLDTLAEKIAQELPVWLQSYDYNDIAILVQDHRQAAKIQECLQKNDIPALIRKPRPLWESPIGLSLLALLQAFTQWPHLKLMRFALASCLMGWNREKIDAFSQGSVDTHLLEQFHRLSELLKQKGVPSFLGLLDQLPLSSGEKNIEEYLLEFPSSNLFEEYLEYRHLLLQWWQEAKYSLETVINKLKEFLHTKSEENTKRSISKKKAIEILTVHASKGLEYSLVISLASCWKTKKPSQWIDIFYQDLPHLAPAELLSDFQYSQVAQEIDSEKIRRLYVAWTRAKQKLIVPWVYYGDRFNGTGKKEKSHLGTASALSLWGSFWGYFCSVGQPFIDNYEKLYEYIDLAEDALIDFVEDLQNEGLAKHRLFLEKADPVVLPYEIKTIECKAALQKDAFFKTTPKFEFSSYSRIQQNQESFSWEPSIQRQKHHIPSGAWVGELWHLSLEKWWVIYKKYRNKNLAWSHYETWLNVFWKNNKLALYTEELIRLTKELFNLPLRTKSTEFSLIELPGEGTWPESKFLLSWPYIKKDAKQLIFKGFIDLWFTYRGKVFFIDYKSNDLGPKIEDYHEESIYSSILEHGYDLQACIYANALQSYTKRLENSNLEFVGGFYIYLRANKYYFMSAEELKEKSRELFATRVI